MRKTQNQFKSHLLEKVRNSAHIIFRHIHDFEENIAYYRGVDRYPPILFLMGFVDRKRYLFCDPSLDKVRDVRVAHPVWTKLTHSLFL